MAPVRLCEVPDVFLVVAPELVRREDEEEERVGRAWTSGDAAQAKEDKVAQTRRTGGR